MAAFRLDCSIKAGELDTLDVAGLVAPNRQTAQADTNSTASDLDAPPHGVGWCRNGCQPLYGMECGMCGYDGPGVSLDDTDTVAEYCCHCRTRTYQSHDGICTLCGKDAEDAGETAHESVAAPPCRAAQFRYATASGVACCECGAASAVSHRWTLPP